MVPWWEKYEEEGYRIEPGHHGRGGRIPKSQRPTCHNRVMVPNNRQDNGSTWVWRCVACGLKIYSYWPTPHHGRNDSE